MRTRIFHFAASLLILLSAQALAGTGKEKKSTLASSPDCLELSAKAIFDDEAQTGLTVRLYCGNDEIVKIDSTEEKKVYFTLRRDQYYTVEISKAGFVTRRVGISTAIPKSVPLKPIFRFEFEVEMMKEVKTEDDFYLDFPVALISYNTRNECFEHSKKYTTRIKREMSRIKPSDPMAVSE